MQHVNAMHNGHLV